MQFSFIYHCSLIIMNVLNNVFCHFLKAISLLSISLLSISNLDTFCSVFSSLQFSASLQSSSSRAESLIFDKDFDKIRTFFCKVFYVSEITFMAPFWDFYFISISLSWALEWLKSSKSVLVKITLFDFFIGLYWFCALFLRKEVEKIWRPTLNKNTKQND